MEWADSLKNVVIALGGAGIFAAVSRAYVRIFGSRHQAAREMRKDEIDVLHETISGLRTDKDQAREELQTTRDALSDLRSEHTAALIEQTVLKAANKWLDKELKELKERIKDLEDQMARMGS